MLCERLRQRFSVLCFGGNRGVLCCVHTSDSFDSECGEKSTKSTAFVRCRGAEMVKSKRSIPAMCLSCLAPGTHAPGYQQQLMQDEGQMRERMFNSVASQTNERAC
ncbi:hypothetical protein M404DRAFT_999816 [Pisolithus tinctorius Marx 270]|uniref:Uncharacterized protein n=1 Tax=Pisolithus tinctorius Marx 270 TaxID=870435 RepID=A0A0C3K6L8_PISTI|nr:hypothetical protein M404DRAFT_999816 [Pisolithus tinctorius Marx 270]